VHILFLTHYFPPEVNAPASRTYENAKSWVAAGHRITVVTCAPNHPKGVLYSGYRNRWFAREQIDGIDVVRVKTYLSANAGFLSRIVNYLSYFLSVTCFSPLVGGVDVVVSTSPQFFCGLAGYPVSRLKRVPWVLEIRDLWPESIIAVGAMTNCFLIGLLEGIESFMYRKATRIVSVTDSFTTHIRQRNIPAERINVIKNGADLTRFVAGPRNNRFREELGVGERFVVSYVGTHGMAHGLGTLLESAELLRQRQDIVFLLVGDGAERESLLRERDQRGLTNVIMLDQQPKERMPEIVAASDACLVHLKKNDLFKTVIPSKIFEAMAMERPILLGVEGETQSIIEEGKCGLCFEPENPVQLASAVIRLADEPALGTRLGLSGREFVQRSFNRETLALRFLDLLQRTAARELPKVPTVLQEHTK
jgi:glycosyltransferase involved in cell wall biosynthesis